MQNNLIEDEIISIELLSEEMETVDIAVSNNNLFFANGILTHNSAFGQADPGLETVAESTGISSTSDVMCSIYQDESDKELGLISLGLMKNRFGIRNVTRKMRIDYKTLSITEDEHVNDTEAGISSINILNTLAN